MVYNMKVTLLGSQPPIWRRLRVPGRFSLGLLHRVLQITMGWTDSHLHLFTVGGTIYGQEPAQWQTDRDVEVGDERRVRLDALQLEAGQVIQYEYDMGDSWQHEIHIEDIHATSGDDPTRAICLAGARACPPEDVGGIGGYEEFLQAIADPDHGEHDALLEWIGYSFDPEAFDREAVNALLTRGRW